MTLQISSELMTGIQREAVAAEPDEACGLLFGAEGTITGWQLARNVADKPRTRFEIDPAALFAALRAERAGGVPVLGYWHSHPNGDVRPSSVDIKGAAADGKIWMIVASSDVAAWRLSRSPEPDDAAYQLMSGHSAALPSSNGRVRTRFERVPLTTGDVRHLRPLDPGDAAVVPLLVDAGFPAIAPILDELIEWTANPSWPVAAPLADFLATIGDPIVVALRRRLEEPGGQANRARFSMIMSRLPTSAMCALTSAWGPRTTPMVKPQLK